MVICFFSSFFSYFFLSLHNTYWSGIQSVKGAHWSLQRAWLSPAGAPSLEAKSLLGRRLIWDIGLADTDSHHVFFQISGTFQVNIPPVLLGYTWSNTYVPPREDCSGQNPKECTFLNIFATIEPQISYITFNPKLDEVGSTPNCSGTNHQKSGNYF